MPNKEVCLKLYKDFQDWKWYNNTCTKCLFIHLLCNAEKVNSGSGRTKKPQIKVVTTYQKLARELGFSSKAIIAAVRNLIDSGDIRLKKTMSKLIITIEYEEKNDN